MKKRKFWIAVGLVTVIIATGFGLEFDERLVELFTDNASPLWDILEALFN